MLRLRDAPGRRRARALNRDFADLLASGPIELAPGALPEEADELAELAAPRRSRFDRRTVGPPARC